VAEEVQQANQQEDIMTQTQPSPEASPVVLHQPDLETFSLPEGAEAVRGDGMATQVAISSIVSVASNTFVFRENSNTPGRLLEQSVVVNRPSGAGFFTCIPAFTGAFTSSDFQTLRERPLGQFFAQVFLRGNSLVCQVRLTDSNADDPIFIFVTGLIVFFQ
jgi:hypothetical protein